MRWKLVSRFIGLKVLALGTVGSFRKRLTPFLAGRGRGFVSLAFRTITEPLRWDGHISALARNA